MPWWKMRCNFQITYFVVAYSRRPSRNVCLPSQDRQKGIGNASFRSRLFVDQMYLSVCFSICDTKCAKAMCVVLVRF